MNAPANLKVVKPRLLIVEDDEGLQRQLRWAYDDYEVLVARTAMRPSICCAPPSPPW
jgi:two-component system NtrC family response regulator